MTGFYDKLEDISDDIDWYIEGVTRHYKRNGWEAALLSAVRSRGLLISLVNEISYTKAEVTFYTDSLGHEQWPEAPYSVLAMQASVEIYSNAYNANKFFWMRSI
jgi:hypothetical protein